MMSATADGNTLRVSRTELRKQKLAEYLAAKGRLKPLNTKSYLKDPGPVQKNPTLNKGKENVSRGVAGGKNDRKTGNAVTDRNKTANTATSRLSSLPRATSSTQHRQPLINTVSQFASQLTVSKSQPKDTVTKNPDKDQRIPPAAQTNVGKQLHTAKKDPRLITNQATVTCRTNLSDNARRDETASKSLLNRKMTNLENVKFPVKRPAATGKSTGSLSISNKAPPILKNDSTQRMTRRTVGVGSANSGVANGYTKMPVIRNGTVGRSESVQKCVSQAQISTKSGPAPAQKNIPGVVASKSTRLSACAPHTRNKSVKTVTERCATFKLPTQTVTKRIPHTLPRPNKTSSQSTAPVQPKTPNSAFSPGPDGIRTVSLDGQQKTTAAQQERLRKLQEWRQAKGITYKRPPMPVKPVRRRTTAIPPDGYWSTMEQEDEVHGFVCAVDQSLNDCIRLIQQGCSADQVRDVLSRVPMAHKFAKYWICCVRLLEREGNLNVLPTFEEAVRTVREPVDELRTVVFDILKKKEAEASSSALNEGDGDGPSQKEEEQNIYTPKPVGALIRGERRDSSVIKYKITATPGGKRSQQSEKPGRVNGSEIRFFTPVRRSMRIERTATRYPASLQEHDPCVTSLRDLLTEESEAASEAPDSPLYVYRENEALKEHVAIELVYEEAAMRKEC